MMTKFKKICNFRAIFFLFLLVMLCIFGAVRVYSDKIYLVLLVFPIAYFLYCGIKKRFVLLGISLIILCGVSAYAYIKLDTFEKYPTIQGRVYIMATVETQKDADNAYYMEFRNIYYTADRETPFQKVEGRASMVVNFGEKFDYVERFDRVIFEARVMKNSFTHKNGGASFLATNNVYRFFAISGTDVEKIGKDSTPLENFREWNRKLLIENLGEKNGNICYSILYGDRATVPTHELDSFKQSGVMHLFAVSGLHVGLLVAVIAWLLSKLKVNDKVQFFLISGFLLGYCVLCSFTPSVVRASVMSIFLLLSKLFERKYDSLNALSLAGIILLVFSPTMFFSVGFQLSFTAVFGIIFMSRIFGFIKFKSAFMKEFWNVTKLSLSAQIGVLPIMLYYFGCITTWTMLANLFLIPLFTLFYTLLFVCNIIVMIIPSLGVILKAPGILFDLFVYFNELIISLPGSSIEYTDVNVLSIALYMALLWSGSKYLVVSGRTRAIVAMVIVLGISFSLFMTDLEFFGGKANITPQNFTSKVFLAQKGG